MQYGHACREAGLIVDSLDAYRRSDLLRPNHADTELQIGRSLVMLGRDREALAHLDNAVQLPGSPADAEPELRSLRRRRGLEADVSEAAALARRPAGHGLRLSRPRDMPQRLRFLNLGTTGTCNASRIHCPTGKKETSRVPRAAMPMALFRKIIDGIREHDLAVPDQIALGLFGDGLLDPLVVERAACLRAQLPDVRLSINTNGAAFNPDRHAPLFGLADTIALHRESLREAVYNHLMRPLRLERVLPKIEQILATFPGKVVASIPISRMNRDEARSMREWFLARGVREVAFDGLSSRCAEDRTQFDALALDPKPIRCPPKILDDLIVDRDGEALVCCQDFQRVEGIGNMRDQSFADVLAGARRAAARRLLAEGRHAELATCSRCFGDIGRAFMPA